MGTGLREVMGDPLVPRLPTKFPGWELALARASFVRGSNKDQWKGAFSHPSLSSPSFPIAVLLRSPLNFDAIVVALITISFLLHPILRLPHVCDAVDSLTL